MNNNTHKKRGPGKFWHMVEKQ